MQRRQTLFVLAGTLGLLTSVHATPQESPRPRQRPGPQPPKPTPLEEDEAGEKKRNDMMLRHMRKDNKEKLDKDLSGLIGLAQKIQEELRATDVEAKLPVGLIRQSEKLEEAAKQVAKRFRNW